MSRKRPTESSWDSDEDLLGDDMPSINAFRDEDIDEDALLGVSDEEMDAGAVGENIGENIDDSFLDSLNNSSQLDSQPDTEEEVLQVVVEEDEDAILGISTSEFDDSTYSRYSDMSRHQTPNTSLNHPQVSEEAKPNHADQSIEGSFTQEESVEDTEQDDPGVARRDEDEEDEESDDEDKHNRGRFTSERNDTVKVKRERASIPDTLEISAEEQAKIEEIEKKMGGRYRGNRGKWRGRGGQYGPRQNNRHQPRFPHQQQHQQRPHMHHMQQQQQHQRQQPPRMQPPQQSLQQPFAAPSSMPLSASVNTGPLLQAPPMPTKTKIHVNPHFRGNLSTQSSYTAPVHPMMGTPRPAVTPLLQQPQIPPASINMQQQPQPQQQPLNSPFQQPQRPMPNASWSGGPPIQQQLPIQSQHNQPMQPQQQPGFMVAAAPRQPYPQQPFHQQQQPQQPPHPSVVQSHLRPQMNAGKPHVGPLLRSPQSSSGPRFNFNPGQNQGTPNFRHDSPSYNDQWNRGPHQQGPHQQGPHQQGPHQQGPHQQGPQQQHGMPRPQFQGGPMAGQGQQMPRPLQQQQQQPQFQPQRPQFEPRQPPNQYQQQQQQQRFSPPQPAHAQQFRKDFHSPPGPMGQQRFAQPQQQFGSPPRQQHSAQQMRPQQPGPRPLLQQHHQHHQQQQQQHQQQHQQHHPQHHPHQHSQQYDGPPQHHMDDSMDKEKAQPIQTVVRGVNSTPPRGLRPVKRASMDQKPVPQQQQQHQAPDPTPQLSDDQKKMLLRRQRFASAGTSSPKVGKVSLTGAKASQATLAGKKKLQAARQIQVAAAQKRRSLEPPAGSPPKQARTVIAKTPPAQLPPIKKEPLTPKPAPVTKNTAEAMLDADLAAKLEQQKKMRERIKRQKELNRQSQATKRRADLIRSLSDQGLTLDDITDRVNEEFPEQRTDQPVAVPQSPGFKVPTTPPVLPTPPAPAPQPVQVARGKKVMRVTKAQLANMQSQGKNVMVYSGNDQPPTAPPRGHPQRGGCGRGRGANPHPHNQGQGQDHQLQQGQNEEFTYQPQQMAAPGPNRGQGQNRGRGGGGRGNWNPQGHGQGQPGQLRGGKRGRGNMRPGYPHGARGGGRQSFEQGAQTGPAPIMNPQIRPHSQDFQQENFNQQNQWPPNAMPGGGPPQHRQQQQQQQQQHSNRTVLAQGPMQGQKYIMPQGQGQGKSQGQSSKRRIVLAGGDPGTTNTVVIHNLSRNTGPQQVRHMAMQVGPFLDMKMTAQGCFIQFCNPDHAIQFRNRFNRHLLDLSHITVNLVTS